MIYNLYLCTLVTLILFTHGILCMDLIRFVERFCGPIPRGPRIVAWVMCYAMLLPLANAAFQTTYNVLVWGRGIYPIT